MPSFPSLARFGVAASLGLAGLVAPVALGASTAVAAPGETGYLEVCNASDGTSLGYVSTNISPYNIYGNLLPDASTPSDLLSVTVPVGSQVNIQVNNSPTEYPFAGAVAGNSGSVLGTGNPGYLWLTGTNSTDPGAVPTAAGNAWSSDRGIESALWTLSDDGNLSPQWVNPDGSTPSTVLFDDLSIGGVAMTADINSFVGSWGDSVVPATMVLDQDGSGACPVDGPKTPNVSLSVDPISGSSVGDSVTLTATITGDGADPTGTVAFQANDASISAACDAAPVSTSAGVTTATCTTTSLPQGTDTLTASYSGDENYTSGDLQSTSYVVSPASTTVTPTIALAASPASGSVFGQSVTFTATVTAPDAGTPTGTVEFQANGASIGCDAKSLSTSAGTTTATCTTTALAVGSDTVTAKYFGDANYAATDPTSLPYAVGKASTSTAVTVAPDTLTATVASVSPGAGTPSGSVEFSVDGTSVGSADLVDGIATLSYTTASDATHSVAAVYSGDSDFTGSSDSTARSNPTITGHISSAHAKSAAGWYRSPVTISFTCTTTTAELTAACPGPVTRHHNTAAGSVTRTIHATDGGVASVTVPYKLDKHRPKIKVTGVKSGKSYSGAGPTPVCVATDKLSGVAACGLKLTHHGDVVHFLAQAIDKAGNKSRKIHGHYKIHQP